MRILLAAGITAPFVLLTQSPNFIENRSSFVGTVRLNKYLKPSAKLSLAIPLCFCVSIESIFRTPRVVVEPPDTFPPICPVEVPFGIVGILFVAIFGIPGMLGKLGIMFEKSGMTGILGKSGMSFGTAWALVS
jgi:hypothetical protein